VVVVYWLGNCKSDGRDFLGDSSGETVLCQRGASHNFLPVEGMGARLVADALSSLFVGYCISLKRHRGVFHNSFWCGYYSRLALIWAI